MFHPGFVLWLALMGFVGLLVTPQLHFMSQHTIGYTRLGWVAHKAIVSHNEHYICPTNRVSVHCAVTQVQVRQSNCIYNLIYGHRKKAWNLEDQNDVSLTPRHHYLQSMRCWLTYLTQDGFSTHAWVHHVGSFLVSAAELAPQHPGPSSPVCAADGGWWNKPGRAYTEWLKPTAPQYTQGKGTCGCCWACLSRIRRETKKQGLMTKRHSKTCLFWPNRRWGWQQHHNVSQQVLSAGQEKDKSKSKSWSDSRKTPIFHYQYSCAESRAEGAVKGHADTL